MQKKVLFIDDEPDILEAVKIILEDQNFKVKTMSDLTSLKEVDNFAPDLILLDILLAGRDAKKISRSLKENKKTSDVPVIILSANPMSKLKIFARECGAASYLQKPFDMDVLAATVKKFIK
jgi:two-component system alkaline phosphatase synthesis response regulator PhoP